MLRNIITVMLLICVPVAMMAGELPDAPSESKRVDDAKKNLEQMRKIADSLRLSGKTASITLNDKVKAKGKITAVTENGFALTTAEGNERQFAFADVQKVNKSGMRKRTKVLIGVGVGLAGWMALACATYAPCSD